VSGIKDRGVETVDLWITDGHQAMLNAIAAKFPASQRQRCVVHKMSNIESHVPEKYRDALHAELRAIFYQPDRAQADQAAAAFMAKYERQYPERTFEEVKKRSKKIATAFRNEGSCLLLFYAVVRTLQLRKIRMPG